MTDRQKRVQLLVRMNHGRAATSSFLLSLSEAIGETVESSALLPLPESDVLFEMFRKGYQAAVSGTPLSYRGFFRAPQSGRVFHLADALADRMAAERCFLFSKLSTDCGAVHTQISTVLRHTASIIRFDGDSLCAMSLDQSRAS
jgi:hypothetical protein